LAGGSSFPLDRRAAWSLREAIDRLQDSLTTESPVAITQSAHAD
jgi:hypothetical protein